MNPTWEHDPDMLLFGLVDLSGVVPVDSEDLDLPFPPRTAETPTKLKRERPSDPRAEEDAEGEGRLSSNKKRDVGLGEPVTLPAYGQNLLRNRELELAAYCPKTVAELRTRIEQCVAAGTKDWHGAVRSAIARELEVAERTLDGAILKPATLLLLDQFRWFLHELDLQVVVWERSAQGETDLARLCEICLLSGGPGRPLKQKEVFGSLAARVVTPGMQPVIKKLQVVAVGDAGDEQDLGIKFRRSQVKEKAVFSEIQMEKGSKKELAWLNVQLEVMVGSTRLTLDATADGPFIVTTNEKQWESAVGSILVNKLFRGGKPVSRNRLCNTLQLTYLMGIRELNQSDPKRPLSPKDFDYMFSLRLPSVGPNDLVTQEQFFVLWEWFGSALSRIRHDRVILEMWSQGYIMGFVTKTVAEELLIKEKPGSFMLRFSSQAPGLFAIAYTSPDGRGVNHYLMKRSDLNASNSLAKFLLDKPFFDTLLQTVPSFDQPTWQRVQKRRALDAWSSKAKEDSTNAVGYDEILNIPFQRLTLGSDDRMEDDAGGL